jgi:hypothetical protein
MSSSEKGAVPINRKIVSYLVLASVDPNADPVAPEPIHMNESLKRPDVLIGSTYKIKSPMLDHAMYVTINDIVLNDGTEHELRRPFEVFINSKAMDQFQWIVALTRIMSAVFRKGGDVTFLVEEMKAVFDPKGGYFKPGGTYMPSIIAEIGSILEQHLISIGMLAKPVLSEEVKALIDSKKSLLKEAATQAAAHQTGTESSGFPATASMCGKCSNKSVVIMDGCATCLNCGASKCG